MRIKSDKMKDSKKKKLGFKNHNEIKDEVYGKKGNSKRDSYEKELKAEILGEFLKDLRIKSNVTQKELAKKMGTDKTYVSKIENNLKNTKLVTVRKYAEALNVSKMSIIIELEDGSPSELQII